MVSVSRTSLTVIGGAIGEVGEELPDGRVDVGVEAGSGADPGPHGVVEAVAEWGGVTVEG
jgi:hypothetical protein